MFHFYSFVLIANACSSLPIFPLREGIKEFSEWPTIPQIYVKGEFIGGCDIVKEMYENGELKKIFKAKNINHKKD